MFASWRREKWLRSLAMAGILVACSVAEHRAEAQALYYRSIPLGERAMGLGGAFSGIANDPSATYYNPAGLLSGGRFQLMGSLSSLVFTKTKIDNAFNLEGVSSSFDSKRTLSLPTFVGTVVKFGRERFGDKPYALAYSTFEAARSGLGAGVTRNDSDATSDVRIGQGYRMRWYGISFGAQAKEDLSFGFSAFLSQQFQNYTEDVGLAAGGTLNDGGLRVGGNSVTTSTSLGATAYHFVFRLGALYRINPRWQLGFMFQPPGAPLSQNGRVFRRTTLAVSGGDSEYFLYDQGDIATHLPIPFEIRSGFEFKVNALTTLSADLAVAGPVRNRSVFELPEQVMDLPANLGVYFSNSTARRWTPNVAVGAEHLFGKAVVAGGLFTNLSAAPDIPPNPTEYSPDQVSTFGASFSVGLDTKGYRLTLGANTYFGRGDAIAFTLDPDANVTGYQRTKANKTAVVLYIAGAVSVASKGAKQVQEKLHNKKANTQGDGDDGPDTSATPTDETPTAPPSPPASVE